MEPERRHYVLFEAPCIEWNGERVRGGYGRRYVHGRRVMVHRHVWELAHGPIPDGLEVMHLCDNPPCYELTHLRLGTPLENAADKITKHRHAHGVGHGMARLSETDVLAIRADEGTHKQLAARYGIHWQHIASIRQRRSWRHLP